MSKSARKRNNLGTYLERGFGPTCDFLVSIVSINREGRGTIYLMFGKSFFPWFQRISKILTLMLLWTASLNTIYVTLIVRDTSRTTQEITARRSTGPARQKIFLRLGEYHDRNTQQCTRDSARSYFGRCHVKSHDIRGYFQALRVNALV